MSNTNKIPVYSDYISFGGGVDEYDVDFLSLESYRNGHTNKLVGYLLPLDDGTES